jgi:hypothetical protein
MLKNIKVTPLAAESFGVRSMCTYVETPDVKILLDAGVSLCPSRFGLPPHPKEFEAIIDCRKRISSVAEKADLVTLSHYHFDHHTPSFEDWLSQWTEPTETARQIYQDKAVLIKNPKENINYSQRHRAWMFQKTAGKYAGRLETADGNEFIIGKTTLRFSEPVAHGSDNSFLGWVLMATIEREEEKFMFAPDVQGPISSRTLQIILEERPQLLMLGGPPLYLAGFKVNEKEMQTALNNLQVVVERVPTTILEHHILRDENWNQKTTDVFYRAYEADHKVLTAAEFSKQKNSFLEATRKTLYAKYPPSSEFQKWARLSEETKKHSRPPL